MLVCQLSLVSAYGITPGKSIGSGTIIDEDGTILTCAHTVVDFYGPRASSKGKVEGLCKQIKSQNKQLRAEGEQIRVEGEQMKAHMSMIVQALAMSGLQIQLPALDLAPPSTSQPLLSADTQ